MPLQFIKNHSSFFRCYFEHEAGGTLSNFSSFFRARDIFSLLMWTRKAHEKKSFLSFSVSLQQPNEKENEETEINWVVLSATLAKDKELDAIIVIAAFQEWHKDDGFLGIAKESTATLQRVDFMAFN